MPRGENIAVIPGVGSIDNASGFVDLRALGSRASLARAIEIAMMSDPPLAIVLSSAQRAAQPPISDLPIRLGGGSEDNPVGVAFAVVEGRRDNSRGNREYVTITGHPTADKVLIVEA